MSKSGLHRGILGLALLLAAAAPVAADSAELDRLLAQGLSQLADRQPAEASRSFIEAILASGGDSYAAQIGLAAALVKNGEPASALDALGEAGRLAAGDPERAAVANLSGLALYALGRFGPAAEALERAIALDPRAAVPARITLSRVREAEGELEAAIAYLRQNVAALPERSRIGVQSRLLLCELRNRHPEVEVETIFPIAYAASPRRHEITRPVALHAPELVYSWEANRSSRRGRITAQAIIDRDGCVRTLQAAGNGSLMADETLAAMKGWVFKPATLDGEPVGASYELKGPYHEASKTYVSRPFVR